MDQERDSPNPIWPEAAPIAQLFLDLLPCWRMAGMERIQEGLDRQEVRAHLRLTGATPAQERESWPYLAHLEAEFRALREVVRKREQVKQQHETR